MSDSEDTTCPLCMEEMDLIDKNFVPCPCGYRVCMWCWHHIKENLNGLCPACRVPYKEDPHVFAAVETTEVVKKNKERRQKERQERKVSDRPASSKSQTIDRKHLHNYRVVQRNLVYIIGVPGSIASEEILRKPEYFGQYGKINKVVVHRNHASSHATVSAYITFTYKDDARAAIQALEGFWLDGHQMRASFGTTKYCNNFIRGVPCNNPECVYLHELGEDEDRFTKEEIQQAGYSKLVPQAGRDQTIVTGGGGPSGTGKRPQGEGILPAPVFVQDVPAADRSRGRHMTAASVPPAMTSSDSIEDPSSASTAPGNMKMNGHVMNSVSNTSGKGIKKQADLGDRKISADSVSAPVSVERNSSDASVSSTTSGTPAKQTKAQQKAALREQREREAREAKELKERELKERERQQKEKETKKDGTSSKSSVDKTVSKEQQKQQSSQSKSVGSSKSSAQTTTSVAPSRSDGNLSDDISDESDLPPLSEDKTLDNPTSNLEDDCKLQSKASDPSVGSAGHSKGSTSGTEQVSPTQQTSSFTYSNLVSPASFNGLGNCAVFPVPVSSLSISIWSNLLKSSSNDLQTNPYALIALPLTELFELTIPPVDASCMTAWPKPMSHYYQGVGTGGVTHAPVGQHVYYRSTGSQETPPPSHPQQQQQQGSSPSPYGPHEGKQSTSSGYPYGQHMSSTGMHQSQSHAQSQPPMAALQQMLPSVNMRYAQQQQTYTGVPAKR